MSRTWVRSLQGWKGSWTVCALLATCAVSACSIPGASPSPTPTTPTPLPPATRLQLSGRVLDERGTPIANASVEVDYAPAGGASSPSSTCQFGYCWLLTTTTDLGEYAVEFEPRPWRERGLGFVYALRSGYEVDVQWVPVGPSPAVRDLRLRPTRKILAGESTVISVEPASSLCTDLEDLWSMGSRCEIVVIESGPGTLNVEARAVSGGVVAEMSWYTTGHYAGFITRPGPGMLSIPVQGGTYRVLVGLPDGAPPRQFTVATSLR